MRVLWSKLAHAINNRSKTLKRSGCGVKWVTKMVTIVTRTPNSRSSEHHPISPWLKEHRRISPWFKEYHGISPWLKEHHRISPWLKEHHRPSPWLKEHHPISPSTKEHHWITSWLMEVVCVVKWAYVRIEQKLLWGGRGVKQAEATISRANKFKMMFCGVKRVLGTIEQENWK